ncbi:hypothetical protein K4K49_009657 [Colletotrichum sp. SAR 10_70]|nr:hypothetical protein K4K50_011776 [Colletotrichum sp. SAR 10_71]KAI8154511.1 hypothetical protein K4K49_009657 [Colletotrichum sp. SAR 10_70]
MFRQACGHWYIIGTVVIIGSVIFKGWAALAQLSQPVIWLIVKAMGVPAWVSSAWAPIEDPAAVAGTSSSLGLTFSPILENFEVVISVIERTDHRTLALSEIAPAMPTSRQLEQLSATAHYLNATNQSINIEWQKKLRSENWVLTQLVAKFRAIHEAELQESPWYWDLSRGLCYIPAVHNNFKACRVFLDRVLGQLEKLDEFALEAKSFRQALLQDQMTTSTGKGLRNKVCKLSDIMNEMDVGGKFKETITDMDPVVLHRLGTYIVAMQSGMRMACEVAKDAQPQIKRARERIEEDVQIFNNLHFFLVGLGDDVMDGTLPVERAIELIIEQIEKLLLRLV